MTEWTEAAKIAFYLMLAAFVLSLMSYYFYKGRTINNELSKRDSNRQMMREYREYARYNGKVVYAPDVCSLILENGGTLAIRITNNGNVLSWWANNEAKTAIQNSTNVWTMSSDKKRDEYTTTAIMERLDLTKGYKGVITYGYNGEVVGITFQRGKVNANGTFTNGG